MVGPFWGIVAITVFDDVSMADWTPFVAKLFT
jgi:hypothetical protein